MKVIIDLIEDIRESIGNEKGFMLEAVGVHEREDGELLLSWQSGIVGFRVDAQAGKVFLFLGKDEPVSIGTLLGELDRLDNAAMMYEVCVSFMKADKRIDASVRGFGESLPQQRYRLFISD